MPTEVLKRAEAEHTHGRTRPQRSHPAGETANLYLDAYEQAVLRRSKFQLKVAATPSSSGSRT
jgi:hypothetical protein